MHTYTHTYASACLDTSSRHLVPWSWSYRCLWDPWLVVWVPLNSSLKDCTDNSLNHWATSLAPGVNLCSFMKLLVDILLEVIRFTNWLGSNHPIWYSLPAASDTPGLLWRGKANHWQGDMIKPHIPAPEYIGLQSWFYQLLAEWPRVTYWSPHALVCLYNGDNKNLQCKVIGRIKWFNEG